MTLIEPCYHPTVAGNLVGDYILWAVELDNAMTECNRKHQALQEWAQTD